MYNTARNFWEKNYFQFTAVKKKKKKKDLYMNLVTWHSLLKAVFSCDYFTLRCHRTWSNAYIYILFFDNSGVAQLSLRVPCQGVWFQEQILFYWRKKVTHILYGLRVSKTGNCNMINMLSSKTSSNVWISGWNLDSIWFVFYPFATSRPGSSSAQCNCVLCDDELYSTSVWTRWRWEETSRLCYWAF